VRLPPLLERPAVVAAVLLASAALHGSSSTTPDPDAFYHLRHAWVYRSAGIFDSAFPWTQFSVVRVEASDLWYGFHLLLVPFSLGANLLNGLLAASVCLTATVLLMVHSALARLDVRWPLAWVVAFAVGTGDVLVRLAMLRPQPLSLGLALIVFARLCSAREPDASAVRAVFLAAAGAAWIHLALAWLAPLVVLTVVVVRALNRAASRWGLLVAALLGTLVGWLARPNPWGGARLAWIQVVSLLEVKRQGLPLPFGLELYPMPLGMGVGRFAIPAVILAALLVALLLRARRGARVALEARIALWSSLVLCVGFGLLTFRVAARSQEQAVAFWAVCGGVTLAELVRTAGPAPRRRLAGALALAIGLLSALAAPEYARQLIQSRTLATFSHPARWLATHARPGDVIFHLWWDQFPHLFFWSPRTYYVNGMDPIFQYVFDPALFWKLHLLAIDESPSFTCGTVECQPAAAEPTPLVLRRDFRASYVFVQRARNPRFTAYLGQTPDFERVFDDGTDVLFRVLPASTPQRPGP
jgi:hypothetical protein